MLHICDAEYVDEYRQGNTLASVGATGVAPVQSLGFYFSDQPTTTTIVPGTISQVEKIKFVTALVGRFLIRRIVLEAPEPLLS